MKSHQVHTLRNGATLIVIPQAGIASMVAMVNVSVGSRDESNGFHGAAHFIEHMLFKGTRKRPTSKALSTVIDSKGGDHNAWTSHESTAFYVKMAGEDGKVAVDMIHDMIRNSLFEKKSFNKEKEIILEEVTKYDNDPDQKVWDISNAAAFKNQSMAHPVAGTVDSVKGLSLDMLKAFFRLHYVPARMTIALVGAVNPDVVDTAMIKFGSLKASGPRNASLPAQHPLWHQPVWAAGNTDKLHLIVRLPGYSRKSPFKKLGNMVGYILGGYSSARLFQSMREKHGLCYGVGAHHSSLLDSGSLYISTEIDVDKLDKTLGVLLHEIKSMKNPKPQEVKMTKGWLRGYNAIACENPMAVASDAIRQLQIGPYKTHKQVEREYDAITHADVKKAAQSLMDLKRMGVAIVGPAQAEKQVRKSLLKVSDSKRPLS